MKATSRVSKGVEEGSVEGEMITMALHGIQTAETLDKQKILFRDWGVPPVQFRKLMSVRRQCNLNGMVVDTSMVVDEGAIGRIMMIVVEGTITVNIDVVALEVAVVRTMGCGEMIGPMGGTSTSSEPLLCVSFPTPM